MSSKSALIILCLCTVVFSQTTLVVFDGNPVNGKYTWSITNDPVMGGLSSGNFSVDVATKSAVFQGTVRVVPSLQAPGFSQILTNNPFSTRFADVSAYTHLSLVVRSTTPYMGWKASFAADTFNPIFGSFKADFALEANNEWQTILIPFNAFSNSWSAATGEPTKTCAQHPEVCPTKKNLQDIGQIGLWAEGVAGDFHLEVREIAGTNAPVLSCAGPIQDNLAFNVSGRFAKDYLPSGTVNDTVSLPAAVCCGHTLYPEPASFYMRPDVALLSKLDPSGQTTFFDSVCGLPLFRAPVGRSVADWEAEMAKYGWPSFRTEEAITENLDVVGQMVVSKCGTTLGSFLPDSVGPRYCIDLVCISGHSA